MVKLTKLFQPIKIGTLELPNRIVMLAINTRYDYEESDRLANFYAERARGGVGLIITSSLQTLFPGRKINPARVGIYNDRFIPRMREWVKAVHSNGGKIAAQLSTYGYWSKKEMESTAEYVGPSESVLPREGAHPSVSLAEYPQPYRALTIEEIGMIQKAIGDAARRAREAGFDAIELAAGVGGNLFQFFANPFNNRRTDRYGGNVRNRARMLTESIANIKKMVGNDFPLICRIAGIDMVPWGLNAEAWQQIAPLLQKAGANALSVYPGWHETREPRSQMCVPRNAFVYVADGIKKMVEIPVIAGVRINDPVDAERILAEGKADIIGMARPLVADPELPKKANKGNLEDIRMCTACCRCYDDTASLKFMTCSVNARAGKEAEYVISPAKKSRKVFVIGGGPAGMEAAAVTALRGHKVTLFEKNNKLGGQLLLAAIPPYKDEWNTTIKYLTTQLDKLKVDVVLGKKCTVKTVKEGRPDAVIVATGAVPLVPDIPGVKNLNVVTAIDVLAGKVKTKKRVVVVGGGSIGCESAEFLAQKGNHVTILEMIDKIGADYGPMNRWINIDRLVAAGVRLETLSKVVEITKKGVRIIRAGIYHEFYEADTVVIAVGMTPSKDIAQALIDEVSIIYKIGDSVKPGKVKEAIEDGLKAALQI